MEPTKPIESQLRADLKSIVNNKKYTKWNGKIYSRTPKILRDLKEKILSRLGPEKRLNHEAKSLLKMIERYKDDTIVNTLVAYPGTTDANANTSPMVMINPEVSFLKKSANQDLVNATIAKIMEVANKLDEKNQSKKTLMQFANELTSKSSTIDSESPAVTPPAEVVSPKPKELTQEQRQILGNNKKLIEEMSSSERVLAAVEGLTGVEQDIALIASNPQNEVLIACKEKILKAEHNFELWQAEIDYFNEITRLLPLCNLNAITTLAISTYIDHKISELNGFLSQP